MPLALARAAQGPMSSGSRSFERANALCPADTPGLLARDDVDRNTMEKLTLAVLEKLPSVPVFVLDVTEECGTSVRL